MTSSVRNGFVRTSAFLFFLNSLEYHRGFLGRAGIYSCWNSPLAWAMMDYYIRKHTQTATHLSISKAGYIQNSAVRDLIIVLIPTN